MKIFKAEFILGTKIREQFPTIELPEIAFSGRSNVGKSSLLNSIVLRKNLAHTSSTPGKTQQINFFLVDEKWMFADLPGFGYAKVSKTEREEWHKMIFSYFENRKNLKLVCLLVDSRHDPMDTDLGLIEWMENNGKPFIIILTKTDKVSKKQIEDRQKQLQDFVSLCKNCIEVLPYSSFTGAGRESLIAIIKRVATFKKSKKED
jgi:GTP-binding protein